jgi:hypothetical protein
MTQQTLTTYLPAAVPSGGTISFAYPPGMTGDDFKTAGAVLTLGDNVTLVNGGAVDFFDLALGVSTAVVTLSGISVASLSVARLGLTLEQERGRAPMSTKIDISGTITSGGAAQTISALTERYGFAFQNISDTDMYVRFGGTAAAANGSIKIPPNALYESPEHWAPPGAVSVFCATTGKAFTAWEW